MRFYGVYISNNVGFVSDHGDIAFSKKENSKRRVAPFCIRRNCSRFFYRTYSTCNNWI